MRLPVSQGPLGVLRRGGRGDALLRRRHGGGGAHAEGLGERGYRPRASSPQVRLVLFWLEMGLGPRLGLVLGLFWLVLAWFGLVWIGLAWFGLVWFGLARLGLVGSNGLNPAWLFFFFFFWFDADTIVLCNQ